MMYPQRRAILASLGGQYFAIEVRSEYLKVASRYRKHQQFFEAMGEKNEVLRYFNKMSHVTAIQKAQFAQICFLQMRFMEKNVHDASVKEYFKMLEAIHDPHVTGSMLQIQTMVNRLEIKILNEIEPTEDNRRDIVSFLKLAMLYSDEKLIYSAENKAKLAELCTFIAHN